MKRRDLMKSAAVVTAGTVAGLAGFSQFSKPAAAAGSSRLGAWSTGLNMPLLNSWPLIPLHAVLLGDGKLLTYGTKGPPSLQQTGAFIYDVWDPNSNSHMTLDNITGTDIFCSAQIVLPQSGNVLITGGDNWTGTNTTNTGNDNVNIYSPGSNALNRQKTNTPGGGMNRPRWYASVMTLTDGRTYIQGGTGGEDHPEIRDTAGNFNLLSGVDTSGLSFFYPRNRVAPNGLVFGYSDLTMYYVDVNANGGAGSLTVVGNMPSDGPSGSTSCDVMYAPGKILRCGGGSNSYPERPTEIIPAKNAAATIDINGSTPIYKKMPSMPAQLHWASATVMADGNVVVTGGSPLPDDVKNGFNTTALLWKANTGSWTQGAQSSPNYARLYHSTALLLPDGTVLSGGGGAPGPQANNNAEIYYPPYLFTNSGVFAARPSITSVPGSINPKYGQTFDIVTNPSSGIQRVTLIKTGSVTHSANFEQRFLELAFTALPGGVRAQAPASAALAPPGNYLLFVFDSQGVPSVARIVPVGS